jgi:hypothetical protein
MAAYVSVPRDLSRVKEKVFLNLTKRQALCFGVAILIGLPLFFLIKKTGNTSLASLVMIAVMIPFFLLGMYERNGQPFEVCLKQFIEFAFVRPKRRPYRTDNYYRILARADWAEKEVQHIVSVSQKRKKKTGKNS